MACYAREDQHWTFYEINPAVIRIAQNAEHFTYLQKCARGAMTIVLGDARLQLQNAPDHHYGLIVLDAFNSDAMPVHLMTQEAIDLYTSKLAPGGLLAFHISNRSVKLDQVLADLAAQNGARSLSLADGEFDRVRGKDPSEWLVMARDSPALNELAQSGRWRELLNSDAQYYGGSGMGNQGGVEAQPMPYEDLHHSLTLTLPPLAVLLFKPE